MHNEQDDVLPASVTGLVNNGSGLTISPANISPFNDNDYAKAMQAVQKGIHGDEMIAWGWWCNIIVPMMESGIERRNAELAANTVMKNAFGYDMMATDFYKQDTARREAAFAAGGGIISTGSMDYPEDVTSNGEEA